MALVTNVGKYLKSEGSITRSYETKSYTICHMADEMQCRLSEEIFCRMDRGYYYTGRGSNIAKAGSASSGDLGETNFRNGTEQWAACIDWRMRHTTYLDNITQEMNVDLPKYQQEVQRLVGAQAERQLPNEKIATATTDMNREHEQVLRTVSDNGDRRLVYGSAYAAIERIILDESEKIKRELDEEDEVLVEASFVV
ncbi:uncharacterized protein J4E84_001819 [Alternaria hordeiaustralica]|uniref:uncharacterized protein n=1 Tax=Alternaria hordeiaustralica TaxID=1187925 RepID=UPI0020C503B9|nr:uncharacterized protein J4E84_001819 [Alternaria hordeiaustralica]KAI4695194.1 hypothetical protein J4E84_001819 [Alternaria hordeiaustralica]